MSDTLEAVQILENKLENLLSNYEFLKKENDILLQQTHELQHQLIEKKQDLVVQKRNYDLLKFAKTIDGSNTDSKETKLKINALIREIDQCIIQLQE